jgi:putative phage-type endonuclease
MKTRVKAELDFAKHPEFGLPKDEWLTIRREGIGSSDVAPIVGMDRFRTPMSVYLDKIGEGAPVEESNMMRWGKRLESAVAAEWDDENRPFYTDQPEAMYQHAEIDCALASPDRFVWNYDYDGRGDTRIEGVLEVKTGRNDQVWADGPPAGYVLQTLHQMEVCGLEQGWIAVLLNGRDYRSFAVDRDPVLAEMLMDREREFWQRVIDRNPPPADGHPATTEALKRLYGASTPDKVIELDPSLMYAVELFKETKARLAIVEQDNEEAANTLRLALGEAEIGVIDGDVVVTWKKSTGGKGRVNIKKLEAEMPEIAANFREPAESRRLLVK